jgi:hypothetical protein
MENQTKVVADSKATSVPSMNTVIAELEGFASKAVDFDTAAESVSVTLLEYFGYQFNTEKTKVLEASKKDAYPWFNQVGDAIQKATDDNGKDLRKFRDTLYLALHVQAKAKAKAINPSITDEALKKVKYTNPSNRFDQIKSVAKGIVEGSRRLGKRGADRSVTELALRDCHPAWARLAKLEELTDREMKIMKALDAVIRACGHDPQKVDLKALGLKK